MKNLRLYGALAAVLLVLIVIFQNTQPVTTKVLFFAVTMPNAVMIGITLLIGIAAGMLGALALSAKRGATKTPAP
jgi:lipopolysaccharide assembly protein A